MIIGRGSGGRLEVEGDERQKVGRDRRRGKAESG